MGVIPYCTCRLDLPLMLQPQALTVGGGGGCSRSETHPNPVVIAIVIGNMLTPNTTLLETGYQPYSTNACGYSITNVLS